MDEYRHLRLPSSFDNLDVGVYIHEPETGAIIDTNEATEELYGYSAEELREMDVEDFTAPSMRFSQEEAIQRIQSAADGESQVFEWQIERGNGEIRWVNVHLNLATIDGISCVSAEVHDITEYRARERRLRLFTRIIRHNLRNEMTILMGYANRLKQAINDEGLENKAEMIEETATEVGSLNESIHQINQIFDADSSAREIRNLGDIGHSVVEDFREKYPEAEFTIDAEPDVWIHSDNGIYYALGHALENAIEHNDREIPTVTVEINGEMEHDQAIVRIIDNGPSIPDVEIEVLSEEVETNSTYHGSGVGLWVIQWVVDALGGELSFEEAETRGNIVIISLPRVTKVENCV